MTSDLLSLSCNRSVQIYSAVMVVLGVCDGISHNSARDDVVMLQLQDISAESVECMS